MTEKNTELYGQKILDDIDIVITSLIRLHGWDRDTENKEKYIQYIHKLFDAKYFILTIIKDLKAREEH